MFTSPVQVIFAALPMAGPLLFAVTVTFVAPVTVNVLLTAIPLSFEMVTSPEQLMFAPIPAE